MMMIGALGVVHTSEVSDALWKVPEMAGAIGSGNTEAIGCVLCCENRMGALLFSPDWHIASPRKGFDPRAFHLLPSD